MSPTTLKLSEKIVELPLTSIQADFDWNCRRITGKEETPADGMVDGKEQMNEFDALKHSLRSQGQDQAVIVRQKGGKYQLIVGFRRFKALSEIAEEDKNFKTAKIKAVIRDLTDLEAKSLNIRENTARKDLAPTDLCRSLVDLRELHTRANGTTSVQALADEVGVGRAYASKLFSIADRAERAVLKAWYDAPAAIGVVKMTEVIKVDKDRQKEAFEALLPKAGRGTGGGRKNWLEGAKNEATRVGTFLGTLVRKGRINVDNLDFEDHLEDLIKVGTAESKPDDEQLKELSKTLETAFAAALKPPAEKPKKDKDGAAATTN